MISPFAVRTLRAAVGMLTTALAAFCAQTQPFFQAKTSLVHVDAEVLTAEGRIVEGLNKEDFAVFDDDVLQPIAFFVAGSEPLDLILLFDVSGSMRHKVEEVAAVARQALHELRSGDRVSVMTFSNTTQLVAPFTSDLDSVAQDVEGILRHPFDGGTHLQQAVGDAAIYFRRTGRTQRRRAILAITDNLAKRTRQETSIIRDLWETDTVLSGLILPDHRFALRLASATSIGITRIIQKTGGDAIRSDNAAAAFPEMMHRLRTRYSRYYPTPDGKPGSYRTIRVQLSHTTAQRLPGAHVYARRGYRLQPN